MCTHVRPYACQRILTDANICHNITFGVLQTQQALGIVQRQGATTLMRLICMIVHALGERKTEMFLQHTPNQSLLGMLAF